jgi:hypothetical protein
MSRRHAYRSPTAEPAAAPVIDTGPADERVVGTALLPQSVEAERIAEILDEADTAEATRQRGLPGNPSAPNSESQVIHIRVPWEIYDRYARHCVRVGASLNAIALQVLTRNAPNPDRPVA